MDWTALINDTRLGMEGLYPSTAQIRNDFQRDYDRLVFSSPFRRLQNKTQVFPLPGHIFVHNRLTHSLEVSSVGKSLARETSLLLSGKYKNRPEVLEALSHIGDIVGAGCLCHDIGNPPFGHSGEKTISTYFSEGNGMALKERLTPRQWADLTHFEGNANAFRLLTHRFCGRRKGGFAMTFSTLASIVKYPFSSLHASENGKFGFFESEEETWRKIASTLGIPELSPGVFARHPLVYLLEAADDICYQVMDIEDAHKLKILGTEEIISLWLNFFPEEKHPHIHKVMATLDDEGERIAYLRSRTIGTLVSACASTFVENEEKILAGEMDLTLIDNLPPLLSQAYKKSSELSYEKIYCASDVIDIEIAGNKIITSLLDTLMGAVLEPEKNLSRLILDRIPSQFDVRNPQLFPRIQSVLDHISAMTDVYALDLFRKINGHSLPAV